MNKLAKGIETTSHIAIVLVAVIIGAVLIKNHLMPSTSKPNPAPASNEPSMVGKAITLPDVDWKKTDQTLVLALSVGCRYCSESADFYKELARKRKGTTRLVAVLPQPLEASKKYLGDLGINVDEIRQAAVNSIGVRGTPTLLLVNKDGVVTSAWVGKLQTEKEREVMARL